MDKNISFLFWDFEILPSQVGLVNPMFVMLLVPIVTFAIYPFVNKFFKFSELKKVNTGFFIAALSFFILAFVEGKIHEGETMSIWWQLLAYLIITIGEILISITVLEYAYSKAPNSMKSFIMSVYYLSIAFGNQITSQVNKFMIEDFKPMTVNVERHLWFTSDDIKFEDGDKININEDLGIIENKEYGKDDKVKPLSGTFLVGNLDGKYVIWNPSREPIKVRWTDDKKRELPEITSSTFSYYKLNGPAYFNFFAWMMLITAVLFIPVALKMKNKTYVQSGE